MERRSYLHSSPSREGGGGTRRKSPKETRGPARIASGGMGTSVHSLFCVDERPFFPPTPRVLKIDRPSVNRRATVADNEPAQYCDYSTRHDGNLGHRTPLACTPHGLTLFGPQVTPASHMCTKTCFSARRIPVPEIAFVTTSVIAVVINSTTRVMVLAFPDS